MTSHVTTHGEARRDAGLDLLRAMAIFMVIVYHVIQMSPRPMPDLMRLATIGEHGVDLFFVLSGWLIGGLYWREQERYGNVQIMRFWLRRWFRTIPPYLVALGVSWIAVYFTRHESFDLGYLVFLQNYYESIPFFLVSWSLCVEEHFYFFLPLLLLTPSLHGVIRTHVLFVTMVFIVPICRWWESKNGVVGVFGFHHTATHLRMEGLILGFWLSYMHATSPDLWNMVRRAVPGIIGCAALAIIVIVNVGGEWRYRIEPSVLSVGIAGVLIKMSGGTRQRFALLPIWKPVALASYSLYLTHPLMIHVARKLMEKMPALHWSVYFPVVLVLTAGCGVVFYWSVERPSILARDRWIPRRGFGGSKK